MLKMHKSWHAVLEEEIRKPYIQDLKKFLEEEERNGQVVYPPQPLVFHAFSQTPWEEVKVVIVGQDPYHGPGQAHGLSFSVPCGILMPPSLKNIFKEAVEDVGISMPAQGCLEAWAKQGVLLLNASLTVRQGQPQSHAGKGWERFTDAVIAKLAGRGDPVVFILWGKSAQEKCSHILRDTSSSHVILTAAHPSPYSAHMGFFGCRHFSKTNEALCSFGKTPINWQIF